MTSCIYQILEANFIFSEYAKKIPKAFLDYVAKWANFSNNQICCKGKL